MNAFARPIAAFVCVIAFPLGVRADDASGIWAWKQVIEGVERESKLTLIVKGQRVVGSLTSPGPRGQHFVSEVTNGVYEFDTVTFTTERDINGYKHTTRFRGKVLGTLIVGTIETMGSSGLAQSREWSARKLK